MTQSLRIAVADDEADMRDYFQDMLPDLGHQVVAVAANGQQLVEQCRQQQIDLVITDIKMPGMDGIEAVCQISAMVELPFILVSAYHDPELVERAGASHVMAYLVKPIAQADLQTAIAVAWRRFEEFQTLRRETADLRQALEDRKTIERAKGILMKRTGLDEAAAFDRLRRLARSENRKMAEVAQMIVLAEKAIDDT